MNVKITKVSGGAAMRTDTIVGTLIGGVLPEIGEYPVVMNSTPLEDPEANARMFNTSPVVSYEDSDSGRQFTTESGSVYLIEEIQKAECGDCDDCPCKL